MSHRLTAPPPELSLPGRDTTMPISDTHAVLGTPRRAPWPGGHGHRDRGDRLLLGRGAPDLAAPGAYTTAVGYSGTGILRTRRRARR
jgi:hypothetical protein